MMFWRPKDGEDRPPVLEDIRNLWGEEQPHRWKFMGIAVFMTVATMIGFMHDFHFYAPYKPPEIEWVRSFEKGRTLVEVKADQARFAEEARIELEAETAEREARKAAYRRLAERMGMDVVKDK